MDSYFLFHLLDESSDDENEGYNAQLMRSIRDTTDPFKIKNRRFIKSFRLPKMLVRDLVNELEPFVPAPLNSSAIPFMFKVLFTLNFLAKGSYQQSVAESVFNCMSQASASRSINLVCSLIMEKLLPKWVRFPTTVEQLRETKVKFYEKWGCSGVIGVIDGTHVNIVSPSSTDPYHQPHLYINRKGNKSINVMIVCDADQKILACNARYPGSCHDSAVWQMSALSKHLSKKYEEGDRDSHLLGDSGYPLEPWLFTPFRAVEEKTSEYLYNVEHVKSRNVIERTIGVLKGRFCCLLGHRVLHYSPLKSAKIIYAAVVLHNIAIHHRIELNIEEDESGDEYDPSEDDQLGDIFNDEDEDPNTRSVRHNGVLSRAAYVRNKFNS